MRLNEYCKKEGKEYLLSEWDRKKNFPLTPDTVAHTSTVPVWWCCKHGHSWRTQLRSRSTSATGCPKCRELLLERKRNLRVEELSQGWKTAASE